MMGETSRLDLSNKVPEITVAFWIIKLLSTTVGETVADSLAVDLGFGASITCGLMVTLLAIALVFQFRASRCVPVVYWLVVVLVSIVGTQLTDALTDKLGMSLHLSSIAFAVALAIVLFAWHRIEGTLSMKSIDTSRREAFYWSAILLTFALGTAAGDLATEALGLGFRWGVVVFGVAIAVVGLAWRRGAPAVTCFWIAYILTRPLGAALGDLLSQDTTYGGLGLGAAMVSLVFLAVIVALVLREQMRSLDVIRRVKPVAAD